MYLQQEFDIRDYVEHLEPTHKKGEKHKYICPNCESHNLSISPKTGKYDCYQCYDTKAIARVLTANNKPVIKHSYSNSKPKAKKPPKATKEPTLQLTNVESITEPIRFSHVDVCEYNEGHEKTNPDGLTRTITYNYGIGLYVVRKEEKINNQWVKTGFYPMHYDGGVVNGKPQGNLVTGKGNQQWPAYQAHLAFHHSTNGSWILGVEGEKCVDAVLIHLDIPAITFDGSSWNSENLERELSELQRAGSSGFIFVTDNDATGLKKATQVAEACKAIGFNYYIILIARLWQECPIKRSGRIGIVTKTLNYSDPLKCYMLEVKFLHDGIPIPVEESALERITE